MQYIYAAILYIVVFLCSLYGFNKVDKLYSMERSYVRNIKIRVWLCFSILVPCVIAGMRSTEVGVDTLATVNLLKYSYNYGSFSFLLESSGGITEILYASIVYAISRFTDNGGILLFVLQLLTIGPITLAAIQLKKYIPIHMMMATYFFCFYNNSLNIMRQSVSCAFIILGSCYFISKQEKWRPKSLVSIIVAIFFHKSAVIGVILLALCFWVLKLKNRKVFQLFLFLGVVLFPIILNAVVRVLVSYNLLNARFAFYADVFLFHRVDSNYFIDPFSFYALSDVTLRIMLVAIPIFIIKRKEKNTILYQSFSLCSIIGLLIFCIILFVMQTNYGQRISMFFDMFLIPFIPYSTTHSRIKQKNTVFCSLLLLYWIIWIMFFGWSGTNIYSFS